MTFWSNLCYCCPYKAPIVIPGQVEMHKTWETSKKISLPLFTESVTKTLLPAVMSKVDCKVASCFLSSKMCSIKIILYISKVFYWKVKCRMTLRVKEQRVLWTISSG